MDWLIGVSSVCAFIALSGGIGWWLNFMLARSLQRAFGDLEGLFDPGTAKLSGELPVRGYFRWPAVSGLLRGRPASVSIRNHLGGSPFIRISVAGHYVLPFQVRAKKFSRLGVLRGGLKSIPVGLWAFMTLNFLFESNHRMSILAGLPVLLGVALLFAWRNFGKIGDIEFPKHAKVSVLFPGSGPYEFSTDFPVQFHSLIGHTEIQSSILNLVDTRRVDHFRSVVRSPILSRDEWDSNAEANYFYRRRLVDRNSVREILSGLLTLCKNIESSGHLSESRSAALTVPE